MDRYRATSFRAALRWIAAMVTFVFVASAPASGSAQTLDSGQGAGRSRLRGQRGIARVLVGRRTRELVRVRRRLLPRARGRHFRRPEQGAARSAVRRRALPGAQGREDRRSLPQFDLDHGARDRVRAHLRRRDLLRRAGLHASPRNARQFGPRARRRKGLRAERDHDHRQSCRLLRQQPDEPPGSRVLFDRRTRSRTTAPAFAPS